MSILYLLLVLFLPVFTFSSVPELIDPDNLVNHLPFLNEVSEESFFTSCE